MTGWLRYLLVLGWIPTLFIVSGFRWVTDQSVVAQERTPIVVTRIYTGDDGKTHAENYEVPLNSPRGATEMADPIAVTNVQFRRTSPDYFIDWHTAPRKQFLVTLEGEVEIGTGDGLLHVLGPGDMMLAEDLTGQGHTTRVVGNKARISVAIPVE